MNGDTYTPDFFVYVISNKATGLKNLRNITDETGVLDSVTYARDPFNPYRAFKSGRINGVKIWALLKGNRRPVWTDIEKEISGSSSPDKLQAGKVTRSDLVIF